MKRLWPAILLAWIAGFVDALGYLALAKVFTAHMSGNSAAVGAELGSGNWHEAMIRGLAIPGFILGIALGAVTETLSRRQSRVRLAPAFALELVLLVCFLLIDPNPRKATPEPGTLAYFVRVWLLAAAMGIQSASLRRAGGARVRTTFISGMLTNMTENAMLFLSRQWGRRSVRQVPPKNEPRRPYGRRAVMFGLIFLSFLVGGICGGFGEVQWGSIALLVPSAGLLVLCFEDWLASMCRRLPAF